MYLIILALTSILAIITKSLPWLSFLVLFFLVLFGSIAYYYAPMRDHHRIKIKLHFEDLGFVLILLVAMICLELGRNNGIANIAMWGVFLLLSFLAVLAFLLKHSKHTFFDAASKQIYWQMMMYGVCAQFWITYSAVFISIVHGAQNFYFVFIAYLAGIILAKPALSFIYLKCSLKPLTINVIGIILGILFTFYYPVYFVEIFLIRLFTANARSQAMNQYEKQTGNFENSYFTTYYLTSASAFFTQVIVWLSLLLFGYFVGFNKIITGLSQKQIATGFIWAIDMTHIILATFMIFCRWCVVLFKKV